jgi:hypothetical protein
MHMAGKMKLQMACYAAYRKRKRPTARARHVTYKVKLQMASNAAYRKRKRPKARGRHVANKSKAPPLFAI